MFSYVKDNSKVSLFSGIFSPPARRASGDSISQSLSVCFSVCNNFSKASLTPFRIGSFFLKQAHLFLRQVQLFLMQAQLPSEFSPLIGPAMTLASHWSESV